MRTTDGQTIPADRAAALRADPAMPGMWKTLRSSCQSSYVRHVLDAKRPDTRVRRIAAVLHMTEAYRVRHWGGSRKPAA